MARFLISALALTSAVIGTTVATPALAGDAGAGQRVFKANCAVCHSTSPGVSLVGPSLAGVVGRRAGSSPSYKAYSAPMKSAGFTWTTDKLAQYATNPQAVVKGNRMPFGGLSNPAQASDLAAYLATLK